MLDHYIVGFATNLGSEYAVVVDIGSHPYRLDHAGDTIGPTPLFREPKLVKRRPAASREPQKRLGHGVVLGADDRELGRVDYVGQDVADRAVVSERVQGLRVPGQQAFHAEGCPCSYPRP